MGKKRDKANENIEILIGELIDARRKALGSGNCPYYARQQRPCENNDNNCDLCKDNYYEQMQTELMEEYIVK